MGWSFRGGSRIDRRLPVWRKRLRAQVHLRRPLTSFARQLAVLGIAAALVTSLTLSSGRAFDPSPDTEIRQAEGDLSGDARRIFMHECKDCHGEDGRGRMQGQPDFTNSGWQANVTDELMFKTIKFGREPMPFYVGALSDREITALVKYIRALSPSKSAGPTVATSPLEAAQTTMAGPPSRRADGSSCVICHRASGDRAVALFAPSVHARAGVACDSCHGGNAGSSEKATAHNAGFTSKPSPVDQLAICGRCHQQPLADFKSSRHFPRSIETPRMTCVDCHGAHTVGSRIRDFSFALYCTNCHGLEYLPELPPEFRKFLQIADEERTLMVGATSWGRQPSTELQAKRRDVRRALADIIHRTDLQAGFERLPLLVRLDEEFKKLVAATR